MTSIDIIGYLGNIILSTCCLPLVIDFWKHRDIEKMPIEFIAYWFLGELLAFAYAIIKAPKFPILLNYGFNILLILVLFYMIWREWKKNNDYML